MILVSVAVGFGVAVAIVILMVQMSRFEQGSALRVRLRQLAPPLAHELPYWTIGDHPGGVEAQSDSDVATIIGTDLSYAVGLALEGVDTDCLDDAGLDQKQRVIENLLLPLPPGTRLEFHHITDSDHNDALAGWSYPEYQHTSKIATRLRQEKRLAITSASRLRRSRLYMFCSLADSTRPSVRGWGPAKQFAPISAQAHADRLRKLRHLTAQVRSALLAAGIRSRTLSSDETRALIYEFLNPARHQRVRWASRHQALPYSDWQTAREQLALSSVLEKSDTLELDGHLVRTLTMRELPTATDSALLEGLTVALPFAFRVQVALVIEDDERALAALKRKRDQANAHAQLSTRRNQEAEAQAADVEDLIDKNLDASIRMVNVTVTVVLSVPESDASARDQIEHQTAEVLRVFASLHGAQALVERYAQLDGFLASLPANAHHRGRWHLCTSENASHMLPLWQSWPGHEAPLVWVENGRNYLVGVNPFDPSLDNPNAFMAGASGAGKSVTTNYLLMHLFAHGVKGLVIDVGGSYRRLLSLFGGQYVTFEPNDDAALNLFYEPSEVVGPDGRLDPLRRRFMLAVLETLLASQERSKLSHEEMCVLDAAVETLYHEPDRSRDEAPILSDLESQLRSMTWEDAEDVGIARGLARGLRRYTRGPHARLLNRPSTVRLTTDCAGFDLKGLSEEIKAPVVLILSGIIWNLVMRDSSEKNIVVFDEVWGLLSNPTAAELLEELYRTSRKYRCSILAISQSVDDFTGSSIAQALVNNSATSYLLRHRTGHDAIADVFHLNERERFVFEGLEMRRGEYAEILILSGKQHHFVARVVLTPLEYWISTTHPADVAALREVQARLTDKGPGTRDSLQAALTECATRWPLGVPEDATELRAAVH